MRKLSQADFKVMPWKNGLGSTTEIYRIDSGDDMLFRVSSARVEHSGPFSDFYGYDRTLVNLGPGRMRISVTGMEDKDLKPFELLHFDGGLSTSCHVTMSCEDLNIFCKSENFFASTVTRVLVKPEFMPLLPTAGLIIFVMKGELCARISDKKELILREREVLMQNIGQPIIGSRVMLASASDEPCVMAAISFRHV